MGRRSAIPVIQYQDAVLRVEEHPFKNWVHIHLRVPGTSRCVRTITLATPIAAAAWERAVREKIFSHLHAYPRVPPR